MREFCTLFDYNYLPRGLVLYQSLVRHAEPFRLRVFCMDDLTKSILDNLALPSLITIGLDELEAHDAELLAVKPSRTQIEYCWTATPSVCLWCLEREPELDAITYLDADLMFFGDPREIDEEVGDRSIVIVPHRFPPRWTHWEETKGVYNVQLLTFRRDEAGLEALRWWRARCLEWCYARFEDGKLGDQKYLDDWPTRFESVHVLMHPGAGLAPWNARQYSLRSGEDDGVVIDGRSLVFFHFHSLRLYRPHRFLRLLSLCPTGFHYADGDVSLVWSSAFHASSLERALIWDPYVREISRVVHGFVARGDELPGLEEFDAQLLVRRALRQAIPAPLRRPLSLMKHHGARFAEWAGKVAGLSQRRAQREDLIDSWRSRDVAEQMRRLAERELADPSSCPPFRTFLEAIDVLLRDFSLGKPARLLDFGCGTGHYSALLDRYFPQRFDYFGCDYSEAMVDLAHKLWPRATFMVNDIYDNRIDLNEFDVVCTSALIDVLPDVDTALGVLLGSDAPYILLHRQRITSRGARVRVAKAYRGQRTYRSYLTRADIDAHAQRHGRFVSHEFHVSGEVHSFLMPRNELRRVILDDLL